MTLGKRITGLLVAGVGAAGLGHIGWLAADWLVAHPAAPLAALWWPVGVQLSWTVALALALGWSVRRLLAPHERALARLADQAAALEQGRFVSVTVAPDAATAALAERMNALVHRLQMSAETASAPAVDMLRRAAVQDPVTGVDNRFSFLRRLTERLADAQSPETALLIVRLVGPAANPDAASDGAPAALAITLADFALGVPGTFAGRLGEREFGLVLPAHGLADDNAARLMATIHTSPAGLACVIGAVDQLGGLGLGTALSLTEAAVARAEAQGAGSIEWRSGRDPGVPDLAQTGTRAVLIEALRQGRAELAEFPVLDAKGRLLHLECPMRLPVVAGGRGEPAQRWLDVAARYRLLTQIDLAALELALRACASDGRSRCVHVSAESLSTAGFVSAVRSRLEADPVGAARLWIEISEVSFGRLPPRLRSAGTVWRRCGARIGIEHAGAALRDLVHIGELELDYVKVDRSFVLDVACDPARREHAQGLVAFVHELGARVIAEGVDHEEQLQALWAIGFDGVTGKAVQLIDQAMSPA